LEQKKAEDKGILLTHSVQMIQTKHTHSQQNGKFLETRSLFKNDG